MPWYYVVLIFILYFGAGGLMARGSYYVWNCRSRLRALGFALFPLSAIQGRLGQSGTPCNGMDDEEGRFFYQAGLVIGWPLKFFWNLSVILCLGLFVYGPNLIVSTIRQRRCQKAEEAARRAAAEAKRQAEDPILRIRRLTAEIAERRQELVKTVAEVQQMQKEAAGTVASAEEMIALAKMVEEMNSMGN